MEKPSELLRRSNFVKKTYASTDIGESVRTENPNATGFCALGCLLKTGYSNYSYILAIYNTGLVPKGLTISQYNDLETTTKDDIIKLLEEAHVLYTKQKQ